MFSPVSTLDCVVVVCFALAARADNVDTWHKSCFTLIYYITGVWFPRRPSGPMKGLFDYGQLKSKSGARHCLFCAGINDQSLFPVASPGLAHR